MKKAVAMTFTHDGYNEHAAQCLDCIAKFWPWDIDIMAYPEGFRMSGRDLYRASPELVKFKEGLTNLPTAHGIVGKTYFYPFDAVKWSHRIFALKAAADETDAQILINMDSDIVTFSNVTHEFLDGLLGDADIAYMPRTKIRMYSECSFVLYRLENQRVRKFIDDHVAMYTTGDIFKLSGWTDCHAFDHLVENSTDLKIRDINEGVPASMHPFVNGPLGTVMDHLKGRRKSEGKSRKEDLVVARQEEYWA